MIDSLGGRKFTFAVVVTIMAFILVVIGKLSVEPFLQFVAVVGGTYVVGNIAEHVAK